MCLHTKRFGLIIRIYVHLSDSQIALNLRCRGQMSHVIVTSLCEEITVTGLRPTGHRP